MSPITNVTCAVHFVATHLLTADLSSGVIAASAAAFSAAAFFFSASAAIRASLAKCVDHYKVSNYIIKDTVLT